MLTELRISNFALIDQLHLVFSEWFQVFTGETGAGKSLLVDAVVLLTGGRPSAEQIRTHADEAVIEAAFSLPCTHEVFDRLRELDFLHEQGEEIIIRRVISRSGRNRIYVNGHLASVQTLQELTESMLDIHGQHDQQSLLSVKTQLAALDGFGKLHEMKSEYEKHYSSWCFNEQTLKDLVDKAEKIKQQEEFLQYQYQELESANLQVGEEESLMLEYRRLQHAGRLGELAEEAYQTLYAGEQSILERLRMVQGGLRDLAEIDSAKGSWLPLCEGADVQLRELADGLRDYRQEVDLDPERLEAVNERLAKLQWLKKKYSSNIQELIERTSELKDELEAISQSDTRMDELKKQAHLEYQVALRVSGQLTKKRKQAAKELETRIKFELDALGMDRVQFRVAVEPLEPKTTLNLSGADRAEFLLSANEGEPLQSLNRVASGGELSRMMLALKTVLAEADHVPVLIFDEVDSGVGGAVASSMGDRLRQLSQYHQVFCITHLPQIASQATGHYLIWKDVIQKRTVTNVKLLNQAERQDEIARMLGGPKITKAVRETASEMLDVGVKSHKPSASSSGS